MEYPEIPGYTILGPLGEGGMATVYLARQEKFDRQVALKVMALRLVPDPSFGDRFQREAHIVAQMSHRNFVPVFDVGQHGDYHYMSMEYLPNGNLKSLMAEGLPLRDGLHIVREIASGLHYAASKNFVHRDIKPDNILFREDHSAVIADFGIARQMDSNTQMTVIGTVVGTAHYMSPEQAKAETIDGRSDLYNLGVIVYEMLTGSVPYDADSALAVSIKHVSEDIPLLPPRLEAFQAFIDRALSKNPNDRFQTGQEMIEALDELGEFEFDLIDDLSATAVMSHPVTGAMAESGTGNPADSATSMQSHSGLYAKRTGSIYRGTGRRHRAHGSTGQRARNREGTNTRGGKLGWTLAAIVILAVGGAGYWYVHYPRSGDEPEIVRALDSLFDRSTSALDSLLGNSKTSHGTSPDRTSRVNTPVASEGTVSKKSLELNQQAREAFEDNRLYAPEKNNAQFFLTTLLALYPDDAEAHKSIVELYQAYLERAEKSIAVGDFDLAEDMLNQCAQISYYIEDEEIVGQQSKLRNQLIVAQQKDIIAKEHAADIDNLLKQGAEMLASGNLTTPTEGNAFDYYQKVLSLNPESQEALEGLSRIAGQFVERAREQAAELDFTRAKASLAAAAQIFPGHPEIGLLQSEIAEQEVSLSVEDNTEQAAELVVLESNKEIEELLAAAQVDIAEYRLTSPEGDNALEKFVRVLALDASNEAATLGIENVAGRYIQIAQTAITNGRLDEAQRYLDRARTLSPANPLFPDVQGRLIKARESADGQEAAVEEIAQRLEALWVEYEADIEAGRLYAPGDNCAMLKLRKILELEPGNAAAIERQTDLLQFMANRAEVKISEGQLDEASQAIDYLASVAAMDSDRVESLREALVIASLQRQQSEGVFAENKEPAEGISQPAPVVFDGEKPIDSSADAIKSLY